MFTGKVFSFFQKKMLILYLVFGSYKAQAFYTVDQWPKYAVNKSNFLADCIVLCISLCWNLMIQYKKKFNYTHIRQLSIELLA